MPDNVFMDSNIWLYAFVATEPEKHEISAELLISARSHIVISTQVLNEVSVNLLRKANVDEAFIRDFIRDAYSKYRIANIGSATCLSASKLRETAALSFWDSLILASALENGCGTLYTEDLQHGQIIENKLLIVNPFLKTIKSRQQKTH